LLVAGRVGSGADLLFDAGDEFAGGAPSCCAAAGGGAAGGGGEAEHAADAVASAGPSGDVAGGLVSLEEFGEVAVVEDGGRAGSAVGGAVGGDFLPVGGDALAELLQVALACGADGVHGASLGWGGRPRGGAGPPVGERA